MKHRLVYEDKNGYCRVIVPTGDFKLSGETEEAAIGRVYALSIPDVVEFIACAPEFIPSDLFFRDAWRKGTVSEPIRIDLEAATIIHRDRLKQAAERKINQLAIHLEMAIENQNTPQQVAITKTRKILRNIHEMNLTHCKTAQDLKNAVPKELHDVWEFYALT